MDNKRYVILMLPSLEAWGPRAHGATWRATAFRNKAEAVVTAQTALFGRPFTIAEFEVVEKEKVKE